MKPSDLPSTMSRSAPVEIGETSVSQCVAEALRRYLQDLGDAQPVKLYDMVMSHVEKPMLEVVLAHTGGNRVRAAALLGINRNTLRKKLQHYGLDD